MADWIWAVVTFAGGIVIAFHGVDAETYGLVFLGGWLTRAGIHQFAMAGTPPAN